MLVALLTLLHLLVFAYWLGADMGTYYSSYLMIDSKRSRDGRLAAMKIWATIDMAPRTSLILAFPTGFTLATAKGWIETPSWALVLAWLVAAIWLFAVWRVQLKRSGPSSWDRRLDTALRWLAIVGLAGAGGLGLAQVAPIPLFISVKLLLLALAVLLGLLIRIALEPFGPAIGALIAGKATAQTDKRMSDLVIRRAKPLVIMIWAVTVAAAVMGLWHPA